MITKSQALTLTSAHYTGLHDCTRTVGSRGGITERITSVRASGRCQTWKTRPEEFRLPVKYGLYEHYAITHQNANDWHAPEDCPLRKEEE